LKRQLSGGQALLISISLMYNSKFRTFLCELNQKRSIISYTTISFIKCSGMFLWGMQHIYGILHTILYMNASARYPGSSLVRVNISEMSASLVYKGFLVR